MHNMSNILPTSGYAQTTATSHNLISSFSNQPLSHYPLLPNVSPYNPFPSEQQPVLPPTYPQTYQSSYSTTLQQWNNPTHAHTPPNFPSFPNPVHLNQQYSVPCAPSHTNTPISHQNPPLTYEHHSRSSGTHHTYDHRPSSQPFPLYGSTDSNKVTTAATSPLNPPDDVHTSQVSSWTLPTHTQSGQSSNTIYYTEQSYCQQPFLSHHSRQSYTSTCNSTITACHSLAPPSPKATTLPPGVTASSSSPAYHLLYPAMQKYVKHLKNVYKNKTTPVYDKEHCLLHFKAKSFINIALVHKNSPQCMEDSVRNEMIMDRLHGHVDVIQKAKTKLSICEVCKNQNGHLARSVLVEGAPGVGKTTFAYELCKQWARGEILWEFAAVLLIKLRDHMTRTAQNMYDLLYHPRPEVKQAVVDELIDQDGEYTLLILDGYDELTESQKKSTSVIQQIMSKELLVQSTLMVTSRPLATRKLQDNFVQSIDQHIEVLGFTEKNIEEYIQSACGDKPELVEDFKSYLSCHPFSSALMFNPLQCAIVTDLYRSHWERGDKGFAPKTLTELYTGLVHILLLRYLTQHPGYKHRDWWIKDLSDLPEEVSQQLKAVTKLAAKGIRNQQYVFDEVNTIIPSETLGFMQKEEVVASGSGMFASHNFLHLTLQEYLAAVNYSQQCSSPEQLSQLLTQDDLFPLSSFLEHYGKKRKPTLYSSATHWPVVLFVAGRNKFSGVSTNIFKTGLHDNKNDDITTVNVSLLHLLYETQSPQLIQSTLVTSRKYLSVSGSSALDWFVIGYCIASSNSVWEVNFSPQEVNFSPKYLIEQLFIGLRLGHKQGTDSGNGTIGSVHVGGYWSENLLILSQLQSNYAKTVRKIELVEQTQGVTHAEMSTRKSTNMKFSVNYPMLEVLTIKGAKPSSFSSIHSLISEQNKLHTLSMTSTIFTMSSLIHYLQSPHCSLHKLALLKCTVSNPDDHTQQITSLRKDVVLHSLDISWTVLDQMMYCVNPFTQSLTELILHVDNDTHTCTSGVETILQKIFSNCPLLETLKIDSEFRISLPLSILQFIGSQQNNLQTLSLKWCTLSSDVTKLLIHSLQSPHCRLYKLVLYYCTIPTTDHTQLTTAIVSSTTITHLFFIDANFDTPSLTALASGLKHNTTIEWLVVDKAWNGKFPWKFTEDQFRVLIDTVDSSAVKKLWLYDYSRYKQWFSDCTFTGKNVDIEWYSYYHYELYNNW